MAIIHSVQELNSGPNPPSGREQEPGTRDPGPPDYKSSALTTTPRLLLNENYMKLFFPYRFISMQIKLIFIRNVLHEDSFNSEMV